MDMMKLRRLIMDKSYVPPYTKCTQTGNPLMFITNKVKNMKITVPSAQSGTPAKISATGVNIWDEQCELGTLNSDGTVTSGVAVCSKNFIPVVAGATYVMIFPKGIWTGKGAFYDENYDLVEYVGTFPASSSGAGSVAQGLFTVPSGSHYMKFQMDGSYGQTYNNNISINFPTVDVAYHQHTGSGEHSTTLPSTDISSVVGTNIIQNNLDADMTVEFACDDPKENSLTVMTYNVQYFSGLNADETMQADILDEYEASVIGLQELRYEYKREVETDVFDPRYWNMRVGYEFLPNGFATNYGLSNVEHHLFTNQYNTEDKGYETAEMKFKGKTIFLICTHLTDGHDPQRYAQMEELFNLVSTKESFILMGDLNTVCLNTSHSDYINMIKPFVDAGYNVANCSDQHGFIGTYSDGNSSSSSFLPIDNIITSADFTMSNVRRDTIKIAAAEDQNKTIDHVALICDLSL